MTAATQLTHVPHGFGVWLMPPTNTTRESNERIGMALRKARKAKWGVYGSLSRTAEAAGVSQGLLSAIERGDHPISKVRAENLQRFPEAYGLSSQEFAQLTGVTLVIPAEGQPQPENVRIVDNIHRVPVRSMAAAGEAFYTDGSIVDYEYVPADKYRDGMLVVQVVGDSMSPTLYDGDYVYVDTRALDVNDGRVVLAHVHGNGFVVKRIRNLLGSMVLSSDNPAHGAIHEDDVSIIGTAYHVQPRGRAL